MITHSDLKAFRNTYNKLYRRIEPITRYKDNFTIGGKLKSTQYLEFGLWKGGWDDYIESGHKLLLEDTNHTFSLIKVVEDEFDKGPFSLLLTGNVHYKDGIFFEIKLPSSGRFTVSFYFEGRIDVRLNGVPVPGEVKHTLSENDIITFPSNWHRPNSPVPAIVFRPGFFWNDLEDYKLDWDWGEALSLGLQPGSRDRPDFIVPPIISGERATHLTLDYSDRLRLGFDEAELVSREI
jgi:hypothetical protein